MTLYYSVMSSGSHHCLRKSEYFYVRDVGRKPNLYKVYRQVLFYLSWVKKLFRFTQEVLWKTLPTTQSS